MYASLNLGTEDLTAKAISERASAARSVIESAGFSTVGMTTAVSLQQDPPIAKSDRPRKYALANALAVEYHLTPELLPDDDRLMTDLDMLTRMQAAIYRADLDSDDGSVSPRYWLFQARPELWHLEKELENWQVGEEDDWTAARYYDLMGPGDGVVLWQSGPHAGIYGFGELTGLPNESQKPDFRKSGPDDRATEFRVPVKLTKRILPPILKPDILAHPVLKDLSVLHFAQATNFEVSPSEWQAILAMTGEDSTEPVAPSFDDYDVNLVSEFLAKRNLRLPLETIASAVAALRADKHIILTGPPGTGKTEFAGALADAAMAIELTRGALTTTATADWTSIETIGGYRLDYEKNLQFAPGQISDHDRPGLLAHY